MIGVYADTVILNWEVKIDDKWVQGIDIDDDGKILEYNRVNVIAQLEAVPELYADTADQANQMNNYRKLEQEEAAKN